MENARKLVLHFDVNETIMVGDPAGGDSFEDCLNKMICKSTFVRPRSKKRAAAGKKDTAAILALADYEWHDGSPLDSPQPPPLVTSFEWPTGCLPAYNVPCFKAHAKTFTLAPSPGAVYRSLYQKLEEALRVNSNPVAAGTDASGGDSGSDGVPTTVLDPRLTHKHCPDYYLLLPAFVHTLQTLVDSEREFSIVVRTFGSDGPDIAAAVAAWAEGAHPLYKGCPPNSAWRRYFSPTPGSEVLLEAKVVVEALNDSSSSGGGEVTTAAATKGTSAAAAAAAAASAGMPLGTLTVKDDPRRKQTTNLVVMGSPEKKAKLDGTGGGTGGDGTDGGTDGGTGGGGGGQEATVERSAITNEASLCELFESSRCLPVLRDDYEWWRDNGYQPWAGKPLWFDASDTRHHPIFFDDNIHNDAEDSIIAIRARFSATDTFKPLSGEATRRLQGVLLVRVPTIEPVLELSWFLARIAECEQEFAATKFLSKHTQRKYRLV